MAVDQAAIASSLTAAITAVQAAISTVGTMQGAPINVLSTVVTAAESGLAAFDSGISTLDADINEADVGGVSSSLPAPSLASILATQVSEMEQLARLVTARDYFARASVNIEEAPG